MSTLKITNEVLEKITTNLKVWDVSSGITHYPVVITENNLHGYQRFSIWKLKNPSAHIQQFKGMMLNMVW
jgi:hypothetical protein